MTTKDLGDEDGVYWNLFCGSNRINGGIASGPEEAYTRARTAACRDETKIWEDKWRQESGGSQWEPSSESQR
jgi:hypothetical protein